MKAKPWNEHRETITRLYIQERRTLKDVRGIMKTEYDFEASIRSYRAHFDSCKVGKYNCKKPRQRRRQSSNPTTLLGPLRSPSALTSSPETSGPGSSQFLSRASLRSSGQQPSLPAIQQPPPARTVAARARTSHQYGEWRKGNGLRTRAHIPRRRSAPPTELRSRQGQPVHDPTRRPARLARVSSFDVPQPFLARPPATIDAVDAQFLPA